VLRAKAAVDRLVRDLDPPDVHFALPGGGGWIDTTGRAATAPRDALIIGDAALSLRSRVPEKAAELSPGARLALDNARLLALARWRSAELRAAQRRVVAAADAERRRIERDLHDGAQQRLVSAALHLRIARTGTGREAHARLDAAQEQIGLALASLRDLAHGLTPAGPLEDGLEAALRELCPDADLDVRCREHPPAEAALAVVTLVTDAAGCGDPARVTVTERDGALVVRVALSRAVPEIKDRLLYAFDRIGAAGGDAGVVGDNDIEAVVPCG
jgi:hypothetical protein